MRINLKLKLLLIFLLSIVLCTIVFVSTVLVGYYSKVLKGLHNTPTEYILGKNKEDMFKKLKKAKRKYVFGAYFKNRHFYLLTLKDESVLIDVIKVDQLRKWGKLNITVLHLLIFNHILHIDKFSKTGKNRFIISSAL